MSIHADDFVCKPLDKFEEIFEFLNEPPTWRFLCQELKPEKHSTRALKNMDVCDNPDSIVLEKPVTFCHYDPNDPDLPRHEKSTLPKTLVCHDMANGYHDDAHVHGTSNHQAYTFWNWAAVDIFCYFSHHLVTIPPVSWINVGHAHGAKVIGTIITEWAEGKSFWARVLATPETLVDTATALVAIAKTMRFDGWLLNVENKVCEPVRLVEFVRTLHWLLHTEIPTAELIWYDSVTICGELEWQNQLNEQNKAFFDVCDGLFTNYSWREEEVRRSAEVAGERRTDVYVGIDVWGRNFYGGGQLNTQQAMKVIWRHGCSAAVFAPAWTHEAVGADAGGEAYASFLTREAALWGSLWPFLTTRLPARLPFRTDFCRGQGPRRYLFGEVVSPGPWYNLRHMQYQPNAAHGPHTYVLSTKRNFRSLHLTESTRNIRSAVYGTVDCLGGDRPSYSPLPSTGKLDCGNNSIEKISVGTDWRQVVGTVKIDTVDIGTNAIDEPADVEDKKGGSTSDIWNSLGFKRPKVDQATEVDSIAVGNVMREEGVPNSSGSYTIRESGARHATQLEVLVVAEERACVAACERDAYCGGGCVALHPSDITSARHRTARLFHTQLRCGSRLAVCVVTKRLPGAPQQALDLLLHARGVDGSNIRIVLLDDAEECEDEECVASEAVPLQVGSEWKGCGTVRGAEAETLRRCLLLQLEGGELPPPLLQDNMFEWRARYHLVECGPAVITTIGCRPRLPQGPILLGHLSLYEVPRDLVL